LIYWKKEFTFLQITVENLKKKLFVLSLFPTTYFDQISPKYLSKISQRPENRKDLVKITYGIVAIAPFLKEREIQIR
jgi:hypothetical protein